MSEPQCLAGTVGYVAAGAPLLAVSAPRLAGHHLQGNDGIDDTALRFLVRKVLEEKERRQEKEKEKEQAARTSASSAPKRTRKKRRKRRLPRGVRIRGCGQGFRSRSSLSGARVRAGMYKKDISTLLFDLGSGKCYTGLAGYDAPHVMFPSGVARPRMLCIMADMDQKDSTHRALVVNHGSGLCMVGFTDDSAPRAVFLPLVRPKMLRIMAGTHQKDSCPKRTGKLDYLGDDYVACIWQSHVRCCCLRSACVDFPGRQLLEWFLYSALFGTTVDACSAQSTRVLREGGPRINSTRMVG